MSRIMNISQISRSLCTNTCTMHSEQDINLTNVLYSRQSNEIVVAYSVYPAFLLHSNILTLIKKKKKQRTLRCMDIPVREIFQTYTFVQPGP